MGSLSTAVGLVMDLLQAVAGVVGAALVASRLRPPARAWGVAGCLVLALSGIVTAAYRLLLPLLISTLELPVAPVVTLFSVLFGLLSTAGIVLVVRALLLSARSAPPPYR